MQIEIDSTPPGKHTNKEQEEVGGYNTPQKISRDYDTPERKPRVKDSSEYYSTPLRKENPESKRRKEHTHESSGPKISAFVLNRLEEDYEFLRRLGSGNFSNVGLYESRLTKEKFAIKMGRANMMSVN